MAASKEVNWKGLESAAEVAYAALQVLERDIDAISPDARYEIGKDVAVLEIKGTSQVLRARLMALRRDLKKVIEEQAHGQEGSGEDERLPEG